MLFICTRAQTLKIAVLIQLLYNGENFFSSPKNPAKKKTEERNPENLKTFHYSAMRF